MSPPTFGHCPSLLQLIAHAQERLQLSDAALADALNYESPAVIGLIKTGRMRLPMNKARPIADALDLDPGQVMRLLLRETSTEMLQSIEECIGPLHLTSTEKRLIQKLRESTGGQATAPLFLDGNGVVAVVVRQ
jgi:hypothetical protein